jgi:general secretion pathway protein K
MRAVAMIESKAIFSEKGARPPGKTQKTFNSAQAHRSRPRPDTCEPAQGEKSFGCFLQKRTRFLPDQGTALILALWATLAMATLVAGVRILGLRAASLAEARLEQVQLTGLADGMINLTVLRLLDAVPGGHPPVDGTPTPLGFGGLVGEVAVQDEAGKVDLNQAPEPLLQRFLISANIDLQTAQSLADTILDWREPGIGRRLNGAKAEDYRRAGIEYGPRGGKMETVDELRLVMGMTDPVFTRIAPALTVVSQNAWPDQAVAPEAVLRVLDGMDDARIAATLAARAARLATQPDGTVIDTAPPASVGRAYTIQVTLAGRTTGLQRAAILRLTGIPSDPVVVYQWR